MHLHSLGLSGDVKSLGFALGFQPLTRDLANVNVLKIMFDCYYFVTVNSKIFDRNLFSRNFAYAKFCENKTLANGKITLSFIDIGYSCLSHEFFTSLLCL